MKVWWSMWWSSNESSEVCRGEALEKGRQSTSWEAWNLMRGRDRMRRRRKGRFDSTTQYNSSLCAKVACQFASTVVMYEYIQYITRIWLYCYLLWLSFKREWNYVWVESRIKIFTRSLTWKTTLSHLKTQVSEFRTVGSTLWHKYSDRFLFLSKLLGALLSTVSSVPAHEP